MIIIKTCYKTYNGKFLTIIKVYEIKDSCKYKFNVYINNNYLYHLIEIKTWVLDRDDKLIDCFSISFELIINKKK